MLHGRSRETAQIDELLAAARSGRSGALVLRGEPGIGKTALLDYAAAAGPGQFSAAAGGPGQFSTAAGGQIRTLRGTGIEADAELAFAALHLLLRPGLDRLDVLPQPQATALRGAFGLADTPSQDTPGQDRFLVGLAALSVLSDLAGDGALLCLVDDAHWLDRASAEVLRLAALCLVAGGAEGIAMLFAARDGGFSAPGLPELRLGSLDADTSRAMLDELSPGLAPAVAARVLAEAAGNPLALRELPAATRDVPVMTSLPLPGRLQEAYYRQVAGLPATARTFLLVASAEETGDLDVILRAVQALGVTARDAAPAEQAGLITIREMTVTFRQPLVRTATYQGATFTERCAAHNALAAALPGELAADRRAWHRAAAATGPDESIAADLERTAIRAQQRLGFSTAATALERAARLTPEPSGQARRLIAAAAAAMDAGRVDAAITMADQALRLTADPSALVVRDSGELLVAGVAPVVDPDPPPAADARVYLANIAMLLGDFDTAHSLLLAAADSCRELGAIRPMAWVYLDLAFSEFRLNRFDTAATSAAEGLRLSLDTGQAVRVAMLDGVLALLAAVSGDDPRCRMLAGRALSRFAAAEVANVAAMAEWALGLLDLSLGQFDAALERFEATALGPLRHYIHPIYFAPDQIEAAVRLGALDRAEEPLARFTAWAEATGQPWALAVLARCRALVSRDETAETHYRDALRLHSTSGRPFEYARTALLYGEWLRRNRRKVDARTQLRAALTLFSRTGAAAWAERAQAELRAAGEAPATGSPDTAASGQASLLTPQELQVVRLAAAGATNRDIAAQLFLSPRTVSHHLYRAFPKLGVTSRTALARLNLDRPDDDAPSSR